MKLCENVTELIGDTPVVRLSKFIPEDAADVYVKLEMFNPSRSVKDRAAYNLLHVAEENGLIKPGDTIIEPTSGNTGIGLAMNAAAKGYKAILIMPDNMSKERINLLKAYGAEVVLTPAEQRMPGAIAKALELQNKYRIVLSRNNLKIQLIRIFTVIRLREIYEQMDGELDAFVATAGTGGTITGTGETLKEIAKLIYCSSGTERISVYPVVYQVLIN